MTLQINPDGTVSILSEDGSGIGFGPAPEVSSRYVFVNAVKAPPFVWYTLEDGKNVTGIDEPAFFGAIRQIEGKTATRRGKDKQIILLTMEDGTTFEVAFDSYTGKSLLNNLDQVVSDGRIKERLYIVPEKGQDEDGTPNTILWFNMAYEDGSPVFNETKINDVKNWKAVWARISDAINA